MGAIGFDWGLFRQEKRAEFR